MQTVCDSCVTVGGRWGWGDVELCCVDHILQEFYTLFLTRFRIYKIATPSQTKMTSKDDIKGFVSLKFLRLCVHVFLYVLSTVEDQQRMLPKGTIFLIYRRLNISAAEPH